MKRRLLLIAGLAAVGLILVNLALPKTAIAPEWDSTMSLSIYRLAGAEDEQRPNVLFEAMRELTGSDINALDITVAVPEDADFIVIDNPSEDLSEAAAGIVQAYLRRGGRLLLITDYVYGSMPRLNAAVWDFGLSAIDGVVFDPGSSMGGRPEYPVPLILQHEITAPLIRGGLEPLLPLSHAIQFDEVEGVSQHALLTTTESAYLQLNSIDHTTLEKGADDVNGPFSLMVSAEMGNGKVVWIASSEMTIRDANEDSMGANKLLLVNAMRWLAK